MLMWKKFLLGLAHVKGSHPPLLDGKIAPKSQRFCPRLWNNVPLLGQDLNSKNESVLFEYSLFVKTPNSLSLPKKYDLLVHKRLYLPKVCKKYVPDIFPEEQNLRKPPKWSKFVDWYLACEKRVWCFVTTTKLVDIDFSMPTDHPGVNPCRSSQMTTGDLCSKSLVLEWDLPSFWYWSCDVDRFLKNQDLPNLTNFPTEKTWHLRFFSQQACRRVFYIAGCGQSIRRIEHLWHLTKGHIRWDK